MGRSKSNTGRKGATAPPEMLDLKQRLKRALDKLDAERALLGLPPVTQKELAKASGLSQSVVSEYVGDEGLTRPLKQSFTAAALARLCIALDADVGFVLIGDGDVVPALARRSASKLLPGGIDRFREETAPVSPPPAAGVPPAVPALLPKPERTAAKPVRRKP